MAKKTNTNIGRKVCKLEKSMNSEAFSAWAAIYNDNLAEVFISEQKGLKRVAMLMAALKQEFESN